MAHLLQDKSAAAAQEFHAAITQADEELQHTSSEYKALDTKALALSGLALTSDPGNAAEATSVFLAARAISSAKGVVSQTLALFNVLAAADRSEILAAIRSAIVGRETQ